jgi:hypothetical protein
MRCRPASSKDHLQIPHDSVTQDNPSSLENDEHAGLHSHAPSNDQAEIHIHIDEHDAEEGERLLRSNPRQNLLKNTEQPEVSAGPLLGDEWLEKLRKKLQTADLRAGIEA